MDTTLESLKAIFKKETKMTDAQSRMLDALVEFAALQGKHEAIKEQGSKTGSVDAATEQRLQDLESEVHVIRAAREREIRESEKGPSFRDVATRARAY